MTKFSGSGGPRPPQTGAAGATDSLDVAAGGDAPREFGRGVAALIYGLAFCSGAAALIYELTWAKLLGLTFGSTTLSAAAVIAAFMGGMGLGARFYHLAGDCVRRPLLAYALLELGIAGTTAALTPIFYGLPEAFASLPAALSQGVGLRVFQFVTVFGLLLVPSVLMGATFPALCAVMISSVRAVDRRLGLVYGINTIGGAAGVLLGSLVLIAWLGIRDTILVANGLNILVGAVALLLLLRRPAAASAAPASTEEAAIPTELPRALTGTILLLSGFTTLAYEIIWFRALRFIVGNSTHALGTVLVIFLVGLGLGSLWMRRVAEGRSPERSLALCQLGIAVLALWAMVFEAVILAHPAVQPYVNIFLPEVRLQPWGMRLAVIAVVSVVTMLPATIFMGLSFPLATRLFLGDVRKLEVRVGAAYLLANVGSILGAVVAATVLIPALGVTSATKACAAINVLAAIAILARLRRPLAGRVAVAAVPVTLAIVLAAALPREIGLVGEGAPGEVVFLKHTDQGTVHVFAAPDDPAQKVMLVDGCKIGCSAGYRQTPMYLKQTVLAHLPMILDSSIRRTLNVGLGSGSTLHTLARYSTLESLDCVEINPAVVEASKLFPESEVYTDPRVRVVVDDAVAYLLRVPAPYDLIISDGKQDPFFSGNAALLSRDYYEHARRALRDDGLFVQWIAAGTLPSDLRIILRTLAAVFSEVEVFVFAPDHVFMVASNEPVFGREGVTAGRPSRRTRAGPAEAGVFADLGPFGINDRSALLARWVCGQEPLAPRLADAPISTWDHLVLDYSPFLADPSQWQTASLENLRLLTDAGASTDRTEVEINPNRNPYMQSQSVVRLAYVALLSNDLEEAYRLAQIARQMNPRDIQARRLQARTYESLLQKMSE